MNIKEAKINAQKKEALNKVIDDIASTEDDTVRWRKIANLAVNSSPEAKRQNAAVLEEVAEARANLKDDFAVVDEGMRWSLKLPIVVHEYLLSFGEDILKPHMDAAEGRKHVRKVTKAFPEYRIMRKI